MLGLRAGLVVVRVMVEVSITNTSFVSTRLRYVYDPMACRPVNGSGRGLPDSARIRSRWVTESRKPSFST